MKHSVFWLTFFSLTTLIVIICFIITMSFLNEITFKREYCLFLLPIVSYLLFQFIANYFNLMNDK
jgi:hypothetical protein